MGCMGLRVISQTFDQMGHLHPCFLLHFSFSLTTVFFFLSQPLLKNQFYKHNVMEVKAL